VVTRYDALWIEKNLLNADIEITCPDFSVEKQVRVLLKPKEVVEFVVERFNEGSCISNRCEDIRTYKECMAMIETETWASSSNFYQGT